MRFEFPAADTRHQAGVSTASRLAQSTLSPQRRELRDLLHRRLKYALTIFAACLGCMVLLFAATHRGSIRNLAPMVLLGLCASPLAMFLQWRQQVSFDALRRIEVVAIGLGFVWAFHLCLSRTFDTSAVAHTLAAQTQDLVSTSKLHLFVLLDHSLFTRDPVLILANPKIIDWSIVITTYSILIPTSGRRCAIVVGLCVLGALSSITIEAICVPVLRAALGQSLLYTRLVVSAFALVAIYGSHKLDVLQTQAFFAKEIGQYRLQRRLGKGGMGEVYLAQHRLLQRPCAVKLVHLGRRRTSARSCALSARSRPWPDLPIPTPSRFMTTDTPTRGCSIMRWSICQDSAAMSSSGSMASWPEAASSTSSARCAERSPRPTPLA